MASQTITTISPNTNDPLLTRKEPSDQELGAITKTAANAFESFSKTKLSDRQKIVKRALELLRERKDVLSKELTEQMGRPISYGTKEIETAAARGEYMLKISDEALKDTPGEAERGFSRYIQKKPLGPVLVLFAWNVSILPLRVVMYVF